MGIAITRKRICSDGIPLKGHTIAATGEPVTVF